MSALFAFLALEYASRSLFTSLLLDYVKAGTVGLGIYYLFRANQRVSGLRTIAALLLVAVGFLVIVGAARLRILPAMVGGPDSLTVSGALAIVLAAGSFLAAAKMSRS
jgi:hypothetical protein